MYYVDYAGALLTVFLAALVYVVLPRFYREPAEPQVDRYKRITLKTHWAYPELFKLPDGSYVARMKDVNGLTVREKQTPTRAEARTWVADINEDFLK